MIAANWLTHGNSFGFSGHETLDPLPDSLWERLNISAPQLDLLKEQAVTTLEETKEFCELLDSEE